MSKPAPRPTLHGTILILAMGSCLLAPAHAAEAPELRRKLQQQQVAANLTRELVDGILQRQLRQLRENGLQDHALYRDIAAMRGRLDTLVREQMPQVVDLLERAEQGDPGERRARLEKALAHVRQIVASLLEQRTELRRRLKLASLSAQVREILRSQSRVRSEVERISTRPRSEQERETLAALKEQEDVRDLHDQFGEALEEIATWEHASARAAREAIELLRAAGASGLLNAALDSLRQGDLSGAMDRQERVLDAYQQLLRTVDRVRGVEARPAAAAMQPVQDAIERQRQLRDRTRRGDLSGQERDQLVDEQTAVQEQLHQLRDEFAADESSRQALRQAENAATQAANDLFEGKMRDAEARQEQVLGELSQLRERLERTADERRPPGGAEAEPREAESPDAPAASETAARNEPEESAGSTLDNGLSADDPRGQGGTASESGPSATPSGAGRSRGASARGGEGTAASREASMARRLERLESSSWFVRLPPSAQQAVRARVRRNPPPGYEERLRRYFESME